MAASSAFGVLNRPNGKWRELGVRIRFELELGTKMVERVTRLAHVEFYVAYRAAVVAEEQRVQERKEELEITGQGTNPVPRPTDKALTVVPCPSLDDLLHFVLQYMIENGLLCNQEIFLGHVPGVNIGDTFNYKHVHRGVILTLDIRCCVESR